MPNDNKPGERPVIKYPALIPLYRVLNAIEDRLAAEVAAKGMTLDEFLAAHPITHKPDPALEERVRKAEVSIAPVEPRTETRRRKEQARQRQESREGDSQRTD